MGKHRFEVWERVGFVTVEADSRDEAEELADLNGYNHEDFDFEPFNDGQYYEIR